MAKTIEGLFYSESHEWVKVDGETAIIGISDHAQQAMGNIVYVDMPEEEDEVTADEDFGAVESVAPATSSLLLSKRCGCGSERGSCRRSEAAPTRTLTKTGSSR